MGLERYGCCIQYLVLIAVVIPKVTALSVSSTLLPLYVLAKSAHAPAIDFFSAWSFVPAALAIGAMTWWVFVLPWQYRKVNLQELSDLLIARCSTRYPDCAPIDFLALPTLGERFRAFPQRPNFIVLVVNIAEVVCWILPAITILTSLAAISYATEIAPVAVSICLIIVGFLITGYYSLHLYRRHFREALERSDIAMRTAAGSFEAGTGAAEILGYLRGSRAGSLEAKVLGLADEPRGGIDFKSRLFSSKWILVYYSCAVFWTGFCLYTYLVQPYWEYLPFPHWPVLELVLPLFALARLREIRLQELASYFSRMLAS
jgi:hypothetical protein